MRPARVLVLAAAIEGAVAGSASSASTQWAEWSTTVVYSTVYATTTSYVTITGPTTTKTDYQTVTDTSYVTVTGPTTTETDYQTVTETDYISVTGPTTTITNVGTVTDTTQLTITQAPVTVTVTTVQNVPQTILQTVSQTVSSTVRETETVSNEITAIITTISRVTVSASTSCSSCLSGLVTCPSRIINPTYTPPAPLPSNYLWGCPPGSLCYPQRIDCNFEQNLPADTYFCAPEECRPVAELPPLNAFLAANQFSNASCAFLTPADDYFNINPLFLGLDFGIFNVYGQATCTPTNTCPAPAPATVPATVPVPSTVTVVQTGSTWTAWTGPTLASTKVYTSSAAPHVTKRAELSDLVKRQGQPLIGYSSCYALCDYAAYVWQSIGVDPPVLCDPNGDWYSAYRAATDCNNDYAATDGSGPSRIVSELNPPRSICSNLVKRSFFGRKV